MEPGERVRSRLIDSQKRLAEVRARAEGVRDAAESLEEEAAKDVRRLRRRVSTGVGANREIAEAEYLDALDRRRRAHQAGMLARSTVAKVS